MHPRRLWMDNEYSSVQFDTNNKRLTLITRVISRLFNSKLLTPKLYYFVMRKYQRLKILIWFPIEIVLINIGRCFFFFFVQLGRWKYPMKNSRVLLRVSYSYQLFPPIIFLRWITNVWQTRNSRSIGNYPGKHVCNVSLRVVYFPQLCIPLS